METPDPTRSPWPRASRATRGLQNSVIALAGVAALLWPPSTIAGELGPWLTVVWGVLLLGGGGVAAYGAAADKLRVEWPACWFIAAGIAIYAATAWALAVVGSPGRLPQALVLTAISLAYVSRSLDLAHRAWVARMLHEADSG